MAASRPFLAVFTFMILQLVVSRSEAVTLIKSVVRKAITDVKMFGNAVSNATEPTLSVLALKVVESTGLGGPPESAKKRPGGCREEPEGGFMSMTLGRVCALLNDFKSRLNSTVALAQQEGLGPKRPQFVNIISEESLEDRDGVQYVEGMIRQLAISAAIIDLNSPDEPAGTPSKLEFLKFNDWQTYAMRGYASEPQMDLQTMMGKILSFVSKCIEEAVTALDSVESELTAHRRYPKEMQRKEKKIKRALGAEELYREECTATNVDSARDPEEF